MGNTFFYTILVATFLFFFLTFYIIYFAIVHNKKKLYFKQELLRSQLEIQEQTFNNISLEIHDNVGQILSLAKVQLNIIEQNENADKQLLQDVRENISRAMTDLRDIAKGLNGERIMNLGLVQALEQETQRINRAGFLNIQFSVQGAEYTIDQQKQLILFRIIQECFQNIIKHACASIVHVSLNYDEKELQILIKDNGKGFDFQNAMNGHQGLGLSNIFKRTELIGGNAEIQSIIHEGTTTKISVTHV